MLPSSFELLFLPEGLEGGAAARLANDSLEVL